jgi:hypothetical protein
MTRLQIAFLPAALALAGCGKSTPCTGSKCLDVAGTYLVTYRPALTCSTWAYQPPPSSSMVVSQSGSAIEVDLQPSTFTPAHIFRGTLDANSTVVASEAQPDPRLGLPFGQLSGAFSPGGAALVFQGTLSLQTSGFAVDAGGGNCIGPYGLDAQRESGGPPDAGASDGGAPDAGDGG